MLGAKPCRWVTALVAASLSFGCLRFQPKPPLVASSHSASARIVNVTEPELQTRVTIELALAQPATLRTVHVTEPGRVPCSGGALANPVSVDGHEGNLALSAGTHLLNAALPLHASDFRTGLVADIEFAFADRIECLRLPFANRAVQYVPISQRVVLVGLEGLGGSPVAGQFGMASLRAGYGGWLGSWRLTAETGIGVATCTAQVCGKDSDNELKEGFAWPVALSAQWLRLPDHGTSFLGTGYGLGLRYVSSLANLPTLEGTKWRSIQGIYFVPTWAMGDALPLGFSYRGQPPTIEIELPLGIWSSVGEHGSVVGFSLGIGVRGAGPW